MKPIEILESLVRQFGDETDQDALNTVKEQLPDTDTPCDHKPTCDADGKLYCEKCGVLMKFW